MTTASSDALPSPTRALAQRLRDFAVSGTASILCSSLVSNLLRIGSSITLTRLLTTEAFGIVGIITSVVYVLAMVTDTGMYSFIVRHSESQDSAFLDRMWSLRLLRSLGLALVMTASAAPMAWLIGKPQLTLVLIVWSVNFVLEGISSMSFATAVREKRLWRLTGMEITSAVITLISSVALAFVLRSYWALVYGNIIGSLGRVIISYAMFPGSRRRFVLDSARAQELWKFSRAIAMSSFLTMVIMQADKFALARLMPLKVYGLYALATSLAIAPMPLGYAYATRVLFPAYSERVRAGTFSSPQAFYAKRRWVTLAFLAATGLMIGGAHLLVALLYDPRYAAMADYLQLVTISTALYILTISSEEALMATGRTRWTLYGNVGRVTWLVVGVVIAVWAQNIWLLVAVAGTREVAAVISGWIGLYRSGLFDWREEALGLGMLGVAIVAGGQLSNLILRAFPHL